MYEHARKMELGDKETSYMHSGKRDVLSARDTSLYAYGHTVRVWYTKLYHTRMVQNIGNSICLKEICHTLGILSPGFFCRVKRARLSNDGSCHSEIRSLSPICYNSRKGAINS